MLFTQNPYLQQNPFIIHKHTSRYVQISTNVSHTQTAFFDLWMETDIPSAHPSIQSLESRSAIHEVNLEQDYRAIMSLYDPQS